MHLVRCAAQWPCDDKTFRSYYPTTYVISFPLVKYKLFISIIGQTKSKQFLQYGHLHYLLLHQALNFLF